MQDNLSSAPDQTPVGMRAERRYVPAKDVAKMLRGRLKAQFPGIKFSVRTEHGTAVNISWEDGPTEKQVAPLTWDLKGGHFNGMEDIYEHEQTVFANPDGTLEVVSYGANYIFTRRDISDAWKTEVLNLFEATIGRTLGNRDEWAFWNQPVPLAVRRYNEEGELLRMREQDTTYLTEVFHQYTNVRDRRAS